MVDTKHTMESVLLVDDEKDNLEALRRLLRQEFAITVTESGIEALKLIQTQEFAVVISDQRMPEITGVDLLEKAKLIRPSMTRILLTGYTDIESVIEAINRGSIYRYVAKPWDPDDLKITLRQAVESYRLKKNLEEKNAELEKANVELRDAFSRLQLLDRAKARFLSLVSHELNTPITALNGFVSLLQDSKLPAEVRKSVQSLAGASDRLGEIVEEVLAYVRLEADSDWELRDFDWEKEMVAVIGSLETLRERRQVPVAVQGKAGTHSRCAPEKMRLALSKLVAEGIARSPKNERVTVLFRKEPNSLVFKVSWKGEPLPSNAFEAFDPAANPLLHHRNLALGLATAKFIVERQGGTLVSEAGKEPNTAALSATFPD